MLARYHECGWGLTLGGGFGGTPPKGAEAIVFNQTMFFRIS